jgi:hypothetical protein
MTRVPIIAVIRNNGYGAGLQPVERALEPAPEFGPRARRVSQLARRWIA